MESGWDPGVKTFFVKILNSIALGLMWMLSVATAGLYFGLAYEKPVIACVIFYLIAAGTLFLLIRYLLKLWKN